MKRLSELFSMIDLMGIRIVENPLLEPKQKLKLRKSCPVSDEFRAEMNQWLLERFGTEEAAAIYTPNAIFVPPSTGEAIRAIKMDCMS